MYSLACMLFIMYIVGFCHSIVVPSFFFYIHCIHYIVSHFQLDLICIAIYYSSVGNVHFIISFLSSLLSINISDSFF